MVEAETSDSGCCKFYLILVLKNKIMMFSYDEDEEGG